MKVSDYVIDFIASQGVRHVFLVTGGGAMHLNDSLGRRSDIEAICNSHEQVSAIAAEMYAKATNNLGAALVTTGPGGTNAVTGVAGAWLDSTPCLFVSGQVKRPDRMFRPNGEPLGVRQLGIQEVDIVSIVKSITKYAVTVLDPELIRYHLERAVFTARTGRPGPVWIDIPLDVQASQIVPEKLVGFEAESGAVGIDEVVVHQLDELVAAINRAERPVILAGNGIRLARAEDDFADLVKSLQVPVLATWCAADLISSEDPLFCGRPGTVASRGANFTLQNADLLLAIGARLDFSITGYAPEKLARGAYRVVVDVDPAELQKLAPYVHLPIALDAQVFIRALLGRRKSLKLSSCSTWKRRCEGWKARYPVVTDEHRRPDGPVSIYNLAEVIAREIDPADVFVSGNSGSGIEIFLLACPARPGQRIFHTAGLGAMGYGIPSSIGACLARGRRRTICVDGDGGFQFNIQDLETIARLDLPIKFFVLNNNGYASIRASQLNYFGRATIGSDSSNGLTVPDISRVASSYGLGTATIENQQNLQSQVRDVIRREGPVVCDVHVIPDEVRAPRLSSFQKPDGSFVSRPLEDLWPFLDRDEFMSNMIVPTVPE